MLTEDAKKKKLLTPEFDGIANDETEPDIKADIGDLHYDELVKLVEKKFGEDYFQEVEERFPERKPGKARKDELIELLK